MMRSKTPAVSVSSTKVWYRSGLRLRVTNVSRCCRDRLRHRLNSRGEPGMLLVAGTSNVRTRMFKLEWGWRGAWSRENLRTATERSPADPLIASGGRDLFGGPGQVNDRLIGAQRLDGLNKLWSLVPNNDHLRSGGELVDVLHQQ